MTTQQELAARANECNKAFIMLSDSIKFDQRKAIEVQATLSNPFATFTEKNAAFKMLDTLASRDVLAERDFQRIKSKFDLVEKEAKDLFDITI